jgi:hypothetical protein
MLNLKHTFAIDTTDQVITSEDGRYGAFLVNGEWLVHFKRQEIGRVCDAFMADALIGLCMDREVAR